MQQRIQLYIERQDSTLSEPYDLVDMFGNETIQLTSTIQNVRDIGRVFTDFTQSFTVPATPQNNKIFRHFYNYHITNSYFTNTSNKAYDIRKKKGGIHLYKLCSF